MPDKGAPLRHRAVDSFAIAKAASTSISEKALNRSCTCSARASVACVTSRGVNFPEPKPAVSCPTPNRHSSFASARNRLFIIKSIHRFKFDANACISKHKWREDDRQVSFGLRAARIITAALALSCSLRLRL
jgi:hypothetical protein